MHSSEDSSFAIGATTPLKTVVFLFVGVCLAGAAGFMHIEGWSFERALFFTLISITTVGYGDEGISEAGRRFALFVVLGGFGLTTFTFSLLMQRAVARRFAGGLRMQSKIDRLKAHTIVCGYGRMGQTICERLEREGAAFVVVEGDENAVQEALRSGYLALEGSASDDGVLLQAGVERAAYIVSAVDDEMENIAVTLSASELNPAVEIIARAERDAEARKLRRAGAARTVSPFRAGGLDVANAILRPAIADSLMLSADRECPLELGQIVVHPGSHLEGDSLRSYGRGEGTGIAFVALQRAGRELAISPSGGTTLEAGDVLIVAGRPEQIRTMQDRASNILLSA